LHIDQIAIGRAQRSPAEHGHAATDGAAARPVELLVDDAVDAEVAAMLGRNSAAGRTGNGLPSAGAALYSGNQRRDW